MLDDTIIPEERYMPSNKQPICRSNIENGNSSEEYEPWGDRKVNSCKEEEMTDESDEELGDDDEETDSDVLATANAWFSTIQRLAKKNESIAALYERVSKSSADLQESYLDVLSLLYPHLLFALDQPRIVPHKTKGAFTKLHRVGVLSAIVAFLISLLACNDARADELINLLMYARGKGVDAVGLRSFIMSHGGINECIEATAGKVRM